MAIILFKSAAVFPAEAAVGEELLKRAKANDALMYTKPEEAFRNATILLQEARIAKNEEVELRALYTQCLYYETKNDFEDLMITAKLLFQTAKSYQHPAFQTYAKLFLFNTYAFNGLYTKAFEELKQAEKIIGKIDNQDQTIIQTKVNLYITFSNYYSLQNDYENQLKYLKMSAVESEKFTDEKYKEVFRYIDFSNRSGAFIELKNFDSAEYYANLSLMAENGYKRDDIQFFNFMVLGRVSMQKSAFEKATHYFLEAERIKGYKNHLNLAELYNNFISAYSKLNESEKIKLYEKKRDSLKLSVSENKNKSLQNLLNEKENDTKILYISAFAFIVLVMLSYMLYIVRKNKILMRQEKLSGEYLKDNHESKNGEEYSKLLEMLKKNDPAFMPYFLDLFPEFTSKLLKINPNLIQSDIEFCALLKLKIPTNDIARYKCITLKSVQNKKYFIRKKLNIPKGEDIYNWFSML